MLTTAQYQTLKTAILAETDAGFVVARTNGQTSVMAAFYNGPSTFIVYKTSEQTAAIGKVISYVALAAMTTANIDKLNTFLGLNLVTFDPRKTDIHTYFNDVFSGALGGQGQATRDAMDALYRRAATKGERLYTTGTGTTVAPGALVFEGAITDADISAALSL